MGIVLESISYPNRKVPERRLAGFSLIEMLVVITIISTLVGITIGSLGTLRSTSLSASAREFADFVRLCRSDAIARRTAVRLAIVESSPENESQNFRRYTAFSWNKQSRRFEQYREWESLPGDLRFAKQFPDYVKDSTYFRDDPSSVRGDYLMSLPENVFEEEARNGKGRFRFRFLDFSPSGRAKAPSASMRSLVIIMSPGDGPGELTEAPNWAQFSIDTLTGRSRVYRP